MLIDAVERYLAARRAMGFKLQEVEPRLRSFAQHADAAGEQRVRAETADRWAAAGGTPDTRLRRIQDVGRFARWLQAEAPGHEVPRVEGFRYRRTRPVPYIYSSEEVERLLEAAAGARRSQPLRREMFVMLFGLLAATGMRVSEALHLELKDLLPGGVLRVRQSKFGKSRLVPLHETVATALEQYLTLRRKAYPESECLFPGGTGGPLHRSTVQSRFQQALRRAGLEGSRTRRPRIHDLRHTFATRSLEDCGSRREAVGEHFVAVSTYLGHVHPASTYWYMQATPELLRDVASAAEALLAGEVA